MKISPVKNLSKVITVHEAVGRALIAKGKFVEAGAAPVQKVVVAENVEPEVEISERTGLPKRQYRRRDMEAE